MSSDVLYRPDCGYCEMDAAAFVEGESVDAGAFEEHLQDCSRCRNSVEEQKRFFLAIDASLRSETIPELPPSFARQVTVMAENDLGGLRRSGEKHRICSGGGLIVSGGRFRHQERCPRSAKHQETPSVLYFLCPLSFVRFIPSSSDCLWSSAQRQGSPARTVRSWRLWL